MVVTVLEVTIFLGLYDRLLGSPVRSKHLQKEKKNVLNYFFDYKKTSAHYTDWLALLSQPLQKSLTTLGIGKLFIHIDKQINNQTECHKHCHYWLDGFKTLKLIHLLTEYYPKQPVIYSDKLYQ